ncbi:unnamed protein product [Trichobilharzia regenti]|nr:unnamed protein product [Trichobilharzia regenti]
MGSAAAVAAAGGSSGGGTSYPRDKGRHRSGSSMSSEIGQYSMHILRENYNSPTNTTNTTTAAYMESISSTYPGRCSSFSGGSCMSNILNKTTVTSGVGVGACGGSLSISSQKQAMSGGGGGGATSKSVLLGGRLPGICQNMPSHKSSVGGGISETDNDISNFLDHCQMPLIGGGGGVCNSSSIGMRDDTSRDSGLVLDMTMPPTSPLDEQNYNS